MPAPDPNYAQQVQNLEQEIARARLDYAKANAAIDAFLSEKRRYEQRLTELDAELRKAEQENAVLRTRAVAAQEQASAWTQRALSAERSRDAVAEQLREIHKLVVDKSCLIPQIQKLTERYQ
jgi:chromosome segregation ATPase